MVHYASYPVSHHYVANPPGATGHTVARAWTEVIIKHRSLKRRVWCLVDTGADDLIVDAALAAGLGIPTLSLPSVSVATANGSASFYRATGLTLGLAGATITG